MTRPPLLTFAEAEAVGGQLHDHWQKMAGKAPMPREDMGWADLVQRTMRLAADAVAAREACDPVEFGRAIQDAALTANQSAEQEPKP